MLLQWDRYLVCLALLYCRMYGQSNDYNLVLQQTSAQSVICFSMNWHWLFIARKKKKKKHNRLHRDIVGNSFQMDKGGFGGGGGGSQQTMAFITKPVLIRTAAHHRDIKTSNLL